MGSMFSGCEALTSLDLSNFDTSHVSDMSYMFSGCDALTTLNISHFDTSNVKNMFQMLDKGHVLRTSLPFDESQLDTDNFAPEDYWGAF